MRVLSGRYVFPVCAGGQNFEIRSPLRSSASFGPEKSHARTDVFPTLFPGDLHRKEVVKNFPIGMVGLVLFRTSNIEIQLLQCGVHCASGRAFPLKRILGRQRVPIPHSLCHHEVDLVVAVQWVAV